LPKACVNSLFVVVFANFIISPQQFGPLPCPASAAEKTEITIGLNPAENSESLEANGKRFIEVLKQQAGLRAKTFVASDYTALIEAMRGGRVDFAFLPPFSLVEAEKLADAKVLLKAVRKGKEVFYAGIIVRADKPYQKIEDLKGKSIAWVDPASTSGFIIPKASLLTKKKLAADKFFGKQTYAGSHDAVVLAVMNGTVDAGATWANDPRGEDGAWHLYLKGPAEQKKIRMVFVSDPIPNETMATTGKVARENPALVEKMTKLVQGMGKTEDGRRVLQALYGIDSMVPAKSEEYRPVREAAKAAGIH
jgi:phosphonate transport system substrate-binding protein